MSFTTLEFSVLALDMVVVSFVAEVIRRSGGSRATRLGFVAFSFAWIAGLAFLVDAEALFPADVSEPNFFAAIVGVVLGFAILATATPVGVTLAGAAHELLLLVQGLRVFFGATFLIQGVVGTMPAAFAVADGLTHITAAFLCLKAAVKVESWPTRRFDLWAANLFGTLDILVVAGGLAFFLLERVGPHHSVMLAALYAAPIFLVLHGVSLGKLSRERQSAVGTGDGQRYLVDA